MRFTELASNLISEAIFKAGNLDEVRAILKKRSDDVVSFLQSYDAGSFRTTDKTIATKLEANQFQVMLDSINSGYDAKRVWPDDVTGDAVSVAPLLVAQRSVTQVGKLTQSAMKEVSSGFQKKLESKFGKGEYTAIVSNFGKGAGEFSYTLQVYYGPKFLKPFASALSKGLKGEAKNPSGTSAKTGGSVATHPPAPSTVPAQLIAPVGGGSPNDLSESEKMAILKGLEDAVKSAGVGNDKPKAFKKGNFYSFITGGAYSNVDLYREENDDSLVSTGWVHVADYPLLIQIAIPATRNAKGMPWSFENILKSSKTLVKKFFSVDSYNDISDEKKKLLASNGFVETDGHGWGLVGKANPGPIEFRVLFGVYALKKSNGRISTTVSRDGLSIGAKTNSYIDKNEFWKLVAKEVPRWFSDAKFGTPKGNSKFASELKSFADKFKPDETLIKKISKSSEQIAKDIEDGEYNRGDNFSDALKELFPPPKPKPRKEVWSLVYAPDGYADSVETFDSYEDAAAEGKGQRKFYLVMGNQQWNEPVGQTDEEPDGGAYSEPTD